MGFGFYPHLSSYSTLLMLFLSLFSIPGIKINRLNNQLESMLGTSTASNYLLWLSEPFTILGS